MSDPYLPHGYVAQEPEDFHADPDDLNIFDPRLVLGYYRRLEQILQACPVDIYAASSCKHPWPWRLQNAKESYPASFWRSQHRILDSSIDAPELSNADVLAKAVEREATAVVAKDYLHDQQRTTESIQEFIELHDPEIHPPAYLPLQLPYAEHFAEVAPLVDDSHLDHRYMLGGLKGASPEDQLDGLLAFREQAGSDPIAHGLGWGLTEPLVVAVRKEPALLDSVDTGSPAQSIQNNKILDKNWRSRSFEVVDGKFQNAVGGAFAFGMLLTAAHRLTEYNDDIDALRPEDARDQTAISDFEEGIADD